MRRTTKKIIIWSLLATLIILLATQNAPLVEHLWGHILGPIGNLIGHVFHNLIHHAPHKTIHV